MEAIAFGRSVQVLRTAGQSCWAQSHSLHVNALMYVLFLYLIAPILKCWSAADMFEAELSRPLVDALIQLSSNVKDLLPEIQNHLLTSISFILDEPEEQK